MKSTKRRTPQQNIYLSRHSSRQDAIRVLTKAGIDPYEVPVGMYLDNADQFYYRVRNLVLSKCGMYAGPVEINPIYGEEAHRYIAHYGGKVKAIQNAFMQLLAAPHTDEVILIESLACRDDKSWVPLRPVYLETLYNQLLVESADFFNEY